MSHAVKTKVIILLLFTLPLPAFWWLVNDIDYKVSWILFDRSFSDFPKWYVYDMAFHLGNLINSYIIHLFASRFMTWRESRLTLAFVFFYLFRIAEYWLFHHKIPIIPVIGAVLVYSLYIYSHRYDS